MKYVIMSGGQGTRWNNYNNITKQEAVINNETILQRIVRQLKARTSDSIIILSSNINHHIDGCSLVTSDYKDYYRSKYAYELIDDEITYLYGDTYYSDEVVEKIITEEVVDIMFFGNTDSIVGVKVKDYKKFKDVISKCNGTSSLYQSFKYLKIDGIIPKRFYNIGNEVYNINVLEDYESLYTVTNELSENGNLISIGIIWNVGIAWQDDILKKLVAMYEVEYIQNILLEDYYQFLKTIYRGSLSETSINKKYDLMVGSGNTVAVFQIKIPNPHFNIQQQKKTIACEQISKLKKQIRSVYKPIVSNNSYDNIIHMTDTPIETAKTMKIIGEYGIDLFRLKEKKENRRKVYERSNI